MILNDFKNLTGLDIEVVSTIDHPYTSPPSHIFDAHYYLMKQYANNILVLNWDVSLPGIRTYRYDLITDTGLIAKLPLLFHYNTEDYYCNQQFKQISFVEFNNCINVAISVIKIKYGLPDKKINIMLDHCEQIIKLTASSYDYTPWIYTKNLLINFYRFVERNDMANFIECRYGNYWLSNIMTKWIPWCIDNVNDELSIFNLIKNNIIIRLPFRFNGDIIVNFDLNKKNDLIQLISNGSIIPSFDVFLWSLYIAGIKHFGNDFHFFERLSTYLKKEEVKDFQLSAPGKDASKIITLENDYGILLEKKESGEIIHSQNHYQNSKSSRINSLLAAVVIGGRTTIEYLNKYQRGQNEITIKL